MTLLKSADGNYHELDVRLVHQTGLALLVREADVQCWIPKSALEDDYEDLGGGLIRIIISETMAQEKGLV